MMLKAGTYQIAAVQGQGGFLPAVGPVQVSSYTGGFRWAMSSMFNDRWNQYSKSPIVCAFEFATAIDATPNAELTFGKELLAERVPVAILSRLGRRLPNVRLDEIEHRWSFLSLDNLTAPLALLVYFRGALAWDGVHATMVGNTVVPDTPIEETFDNLSAQLLGMLVGERDGARTGEQGVW